MESALFLVRHGLKKQTKSLNLLTIKVGASHYDKMDKIFFNSMQIYTSNILLHPLILGGRLLIISLQSDCVTNSTNIMFDILLCVVEN